MGKPQTAALLKGETFGAGTDRFDGAPADSTMRADRLSFKDVQLVRSMPAVPAA